MNTDTPETEKLTDADFKNIDEDMETATLQAYNRLHDLCADMERERNQARQERDELIKLIQEVSNAAENSGLPLLKMYMDEKMQSILEKLKEPKSEGVS